MGVVESDFDGVASGDEGSGVELELGFSAVGGVADLSAGDADAVDSEFDEGGEGAIISDGERPIIGGAVDQDRRVDETGLCGESGEQHARA